MKNKKSLLSLGLLALVAILGVGYAVVSSVGLSINGTAKTLTTDSEIKVAFNGEVDYTEGTSFVDTNNTKATANSKTATITVKDLSRIGDTATVTYTIENYESDLAATLGAPVVKIGGEDVNEYFEVTTTYPQGTSLAAGKTATIAVTVTLKKTPTTAQEETISITLDAAPVAQ